MPDPHLMQPVETVRLADRASDAGPFHEDREAAEKEFRKLRKELADLQHTLYAEGKRKMLVVFQAMDAGGKDSAIRRVFKGVNPQGVRVTSFKVPSAEERAHGFLWRIHKAAPRTGMIGVFNRSHYEDVLVVRVNEIVPEAVWRTRYDSINQFEQMLTDAGTTILKFYLHISLDEQKRRFQDRLDKPHKRWKFDLGDLEKRKHWDDYMAAYEDALGRCSTETAPWYVIPSDNKWYRNLAISRILVGKMREMDPQFPEQKDDLTGVEIV